MIVKVHLLGPGRRVDRRTTMQPASGTFVHLLLPCEEVVAVPCASVASHIRIVIIDTSYRIPHEPELCPSYTGLG